MTDRSILVLDYTKDGVEADAIVAWLPDDARVESHHVTSDDQFADEGPGTEFTHVIHSGAEHDVMDVAPNAQNLAAYIARLSKAGVWQYGICFGHQAMCAVFGGLHTVRRNPNGHEIGWAEISFTDQAQRLFGVAATELIFQLHRDEVIELPPGAELLATNAHTPVQGFIHRDRKLLGTQFHPEMDREFGNEIFLEYRPLFEQYGLDVDDVINGGPSVDAGELFIGTFLDWQ